MHDICMLNRYRDETHLAEICGHHMKHNVLESLKQQSNAEDQLSQLFDSDQNLLVITVTPMCVANSNKT